MNELYCIVNKEGYKSLRLFPFIITIIMNRQYGYSIELTLFRITFKFTIRIEDFF